MNSAIITGITGQDGAYLAELLLGKGYKVFGAYRRLSSSCFWRLDELAITHHPNLRLVEFDITDLSSCIRLLQIDDINELYNLAAQSFVRVSFEQPITTTEINACGVVNLLEAIRLVNPGIRMYQASTSEMFGKAVDTPQDEETPFHPRSPYAVTKLFSHWMCINYLESYGIYCSRGILFNHESPLRGREFVTRKITDGLAKIKLGISEVLELGNLDARRDWGYAREYVDGMWRMLQKDEPNSYVLATGRCETVRTFATMAAKAAKMELVWQGEGPEEVGLDDKSGKAIVRVHGKYYRPAEVELLIGNAARAREGLGWQPQTTLEQLCAMMVEADLARNQKGFSF